MFLTGQKQHFNNHDDNLLLMTDSERSARRVFSTSNASPNVPEPSELFQEPGPVIIRHLKSENQC